MTGRVRVGNENQHFFVHNSAFSNRILCTFRSGLDITVHHMQLIRFIKCRNSWVLPFNSCVSFRECFIVGHNILCQINVLSLSVSLHTSVHSHAQTQQQKNAQSSIAFMQNNMHYINPPRPRTPRPPRNTHTFEFTRTLLTRSLAGDVQKFIACS